MCICLKSSLYKFCWIEDMNECMKVLMNRRYEWMYGWNEKYVYMSMNIWQEKQVKVLMYRRYEWMYESSDV